jgi:hypothetical protein
VVDGVAVGASEWAGGRSTIPPPAMSHLVDGRPSSGEGSES